MCVAVRRNDPRATRWSEAGPGSGKLRTMADEDPGNDTPSLELPSWSFGRKRRGKSSDDTEVMPPVDAPVPAPLVEPVEPAPTTAAPPEPAPAPPLFADEVPEPAPEQASQSVPHPEIEPDPEGDTGLDTRAVRPRRSRPIVGGRVAAVVTGALVGIFTVGLTWGSQRLCEVVRGTSSCGGPGLFLLIAILVAMVLLGSLLLRAFAVPEPGSTSFLAVGLLAVLSLLFLVDVLFNWWMILVIPLFSVLTFLLSHWVTTAFIEPAEH